MFETVNLALIIRLNILPSLFGKNFLQLDVLSIDYK